MTAQQDSEAAELDKAYGEVFATASGKLVLYDMLEMCGMYTAAFTGENNATNFMLGKQEAGKQLIDKLNGVDQRFYPQLLLAIADIREMNKAASERAAKLEQEDNDIEA